MTIQQEAVEKIMKLPEDGVRLILVMVDELARQQGISFESDNEKKENASLTHRKEVFQNMLKRREQSVYPRDFDYKEALGAAINEKYNLAD